MMPTTTDYSDEVRYLINEAQHESLVYRNVAIKKLMHLNTAESAHASAIVSQSAARESHDDRTRFSQSVSVCDAKACDLSSTLALVPISLAAHGKDARCCAS